LYSQLIKQFFALHDGWTCLNCQIPAIPMASDDANDNPASSVDQVARTFVWDWSLLTTASRTLFTDLVADCFAKSKSQTSNNFWVRGGKAGVFMLNIGAVAVEGESNHELYCNLKVNVHTLFARASDSSTALFSGQRVGSTTDPDAEVVFVGVVTSTLRQHHYDPYLLTASPSPASKELILFDLRLAKESDLPPHPPTRYELSDGVFAKEELMNQAIAALPELIIKLLGRTGLDTLETATVIPSASDDDDDLDIELLSDMMDSADDANGDDVTSSEQLAADRRFAEALQLAENPKKSRKSKRTATGKASPVRSESGSARATIEGLQAEVTRLTRELNDGKEALNDTKEELADTKAALVTEQKSVARLKRGKCPRVQCVKNRKALEVFRAQREASPAYFSTPEKPKGGRSNRRKRTREQSLSSSPCRDCPNSKRKRVAAESKARDLQETLEEREDELDNLRLKLAVPPAPATPAAVHVVAAASPSFSLGDVSKFLVDVNASQQKPTDSVKLVEAVMRSRSMSVMEPPVVPLAPTKPDSSKSRSYTIEEFETIAKMLNSNIKLQI
jgi:hypothetical protein